VQPWRLPRQRFDQAWMAMSETDSRVGAHHVDIATTIFVPDMDTLAAHNSNGQRLVIRRAITGFEATQFAHCSLFNCAVWSAGLDTDCIRRSWFRCRANRSRRRLASPAATE